MENLKTKVENRSIVGTVELRAGYKSRHVEGYALKFNTLSKDLGGWNEIISKDALRGADFSDVVALFNHNQDSILARTTSKTLTLEVDKIGLRYSFDAPETSAGNDLLVSLKRGDVAGSSFAFSVNENGDTWVKTNGQIIRTIAKFETIIDVSPVVNPAYLDTQVALRNFESFKTLRPELFEQKTLLDKKTKKGYSPDSLTAEILSL